jgi:hypothetical protein
MTAEEIKAVIHEVLAEQNKSHDEVVLKTIAAILTSFGIDEEDRKEVRADFVHLRKWRKSVEQAQSYTFKAVITVIATGFLGAVWLGFKTMLGK